MSSCILCEFSADDLKRSLERNGRRSTGSWVYIPYDFQLAPRALLYEEAAVERLTSDVSRWGDL